MQKSIDFSTFLAFSKYFLTDLYLSGFEEIMSENEKSEPVLYFSFTSRSVFNFLRAAMISSSKPYNPLYLNDAGLKTKAGNAWSTPGVYKILTNPFYKGTYLYNVHSDRRAVEKRGEGEWITIDEHHEPIVSEILLNRIQFILKRNKRGGVPEEKASN